MNMPDSEPNLVIHEKRTKEWGVGLVTNATEDRMEVQFQDGKLRAFKKGFLHMLVPAPEEQQTESIVEELMERLGASLAVQRDRERQGQAEPLMTFNEQLKVFRHLYPGGFQDENYETSVRFDPEGRRLKRLRDPAIEYAKETLSRESLDAMMAESNWSGIHDAVIKSLRKTSLASPSAVVDPLRDMDEENHERFAQALYGMLWGEDDQIEARVKEFIAAIEAGGPVKMTGRWSRCCRPSSTREVHHHPPQGLRGPGPDGDPQPHLPVGPGPAVLLPLPPHGREGP